tara:strand:+ start:247 stop:552 length:306 start_codon:yes stop_codon:yes gene_type:complete
MDKEFNNTDIIRILQQYKNKRNQEYNKYHSVLKNDPDFKMKNTERSKEYYINNKDIIKVKNQDKKDLNNAKSLLRYYKKNNILHLFKMKHEDKLKLVEHLL